MNKRQALLVKIFLFVFSVNTLTLCLYFTFHGKSSSPTSDGDFMFMGNRLPLTENRPAYQKYFKPWPILPSYVPWSQFTAPLRSCEAYFGNGFSLRLDLLRPNVPAEKKGGNPGGWFRCWYSETLRSSICEGRRVRMWPERISMSNGGENLEEVIGRSEEEELPDFRDGAFEVDGGDSINGEIALIDKKFLDQFVPQGEVTRHTMRGLFGSIRVHGGKNFDCLKWIEEPTLFVTRFEYANLFHTVTDWYSAYVASRVVGLPNRPHLVFLDGHSRTPLEETWKALFSSLKYAKNLSGPVCFRHAIFSPLGYETALFKGLTEKIDCHGGSARDLWKKPDEKRTARISEFGEMIREAFGFSVNKHIEKPMNYQNILFVRREDYLAHPRHDGKVESRLSNEEEIFDSLQSWVANYSACKINLVNGLFAHMPMKEQIRAIQDAKIIIAAHGAGLTHIVSALPRTVILEIISSHYRRPHFALIAKWKGLDYYSIDLDESYAEPGVVIDRLRSITRGLGC